MANAYFSPFPERHQAAMHGGAPDPIPRGSATPKSGRESTYTRKAPGPSRRIAKIVGRRVKTSMAENV